MGSPILEVQSLSSFSLNNATNISTQLQKEKDDFNNKLTRLRMKLNGPKRDGSSVRRSRDGRKKEQPKEFKTPESGKKKNENSTFLKTNSSKKSSPVHSQL
jgi:hypothetical protein